MNRALRRVAIAVLLMFGALLVNANVLQVGRASSLKNNALNQKRILLDQYDHKRGPIVVDGSAVALSRKTSDQYKYLRMYPGGAAYAPITGYFPIAGFITGIERAENDILSGDADELFIRRLSDYFTGREPEGGSVVLTIDDQVQQTAYNALAGKRGAVVALDPRTGAILAMASSPSFDPNPLASHDPDQVNRAYQQLNQRSDAPLLNRAINQTYPPGSTFKVITTAAALSSGDYTPTSQLRAPDQLTLPQTTAKLQNFEGEQCAGGGSITLAEALRISCNTAYGALGMELGQDAIKKQAEAFGFGRSLSIPIPVSRSVFPSDLAPPNVAFASIGQDSDAVTPLQMAMVAAGIANDGVVMQPYLVKRTETQDFATLSTTRPKEFSQAVDSDVAHQLSTMMQAVVASGTGTAAQIPGVTVAGKTGTAENGAGRTTHAWFISVAPAENPQVAIAVIVENGGVGGQVAAPIARQVMEAVLSR
jgi:peptidoglycan glycosyltransferase